ncbi:uncharacterized protein TOT_010000125 [Theileria orientalis strain Shintoku]|uniref:Uncharacterized protein n=1 Tax=Theileria orientalis strain Shintoku TaxID=869250 RepID=J7MBX0_THEOR|nr:uncharacterized protein TOT_010000125 [Theileria orientalis strain Shintoku]BAM38657.1 uncharacterized protein TOT_010000125 [Theileria orientalis strain Shintoku]|eukprot:XP_009688958.1 uncharacterized protein TOT_010000125 [Theileria orientalis strain Shintoku]
MQFLKPIPLVFKLYFFYGLLVYFDHGRFANENITRNNHFFVESLVIPRQSCFVNNFHKPYTHSRYDTGLYAVPKKKPSRRRTRIRKTAWMKRFPKNYKKPMMLDMFDIIKYTDGTFTKARTIHQNWLNLPNTRLDGKHVFNKEVRPSW